MMCVCVQKHLKKKKKILKVNAIAIGYCLEVKDQTFISFAVYQLIRTQVVHEEVKDLITVV